MTDEESRKAFEATVLKISIFRDFARIDGEHEYIDTALEARWQFWEAAVEWATNGERERCAKIAWAAHEDGKMRLRYIREMEQKP